MSTSILNGRRKEYLDIPSHRKEGVFGCAVCQECSKNDQLECSVQSCALDRNRQDGHVHLTVTIPESLTDSGPIPEKTRGD